MRTSVLLLALVVSPAVSQRGVRSYIVRPGDTLYQLARELYGDESLYHLLVEYNDTHNRRIASSKGLRVGQSLFLPTLAQLRVRRWRRMQPPTYRFLSDRNCAAYCRLFARQCFGLKYARQPAWRIADGCSVLWSARSSSPSLRRELRRSGLNESHLSSDVLLKRSNPAERARLFDAAARDLKPRLRAGALLGLYYSHSKFNRPGRRFTHVALYVGRDRANQPVFVHQFRGKGRSTVLRDLFAYPSKCKPARSGALFMPVTLFIPKHGSVVR